LGVYRVHDITKEEFVANVIHVKMQRYHMYITRHAIRAINAIAFYQTKQEIIDNDMV
jgi:hypothetical protein